MVTAMSPETVGDVTEIHHRKRQSVHFQLRRRKLLRPNSSPTISNTRHRNYCSRRRGSCGLLCLLVIPTTNYGNPAIGGNGGGIDSVSSSPDDLDNTTR